MYNLKLEEENDKGMKMIVFMLLIEFLLIVFVVIYMTKIIVYRNDSHCIMLKIPGQGYILGNVDKTAWSKHSFMQFRGVPYAESPSGPLRFKVRYLNLIVDEYF